jgi:uncharacterized phage-associated protein
LILAERTAKIVALEVLLSGEHAMSSAVAHDPKAVANYLLDCAREDGEALSPMKLIKLAYLSHGWHLALTDQPLLRENVEAWRYGPVVPSIYHEYKGFGNQAITRYATWPDRVDNEVEWVTPKLTTASESTLAILKKVWQTYKRYGATQLSAMTHQLGTPWYITWYERGGQDRLGTDIPDDLIRDHFKALAAKNG